MQKFKAKLKNAPTDASQVCSSVRPGLNKLEKVSDQDKVRTLNNLDVNLPQYIRGTDLFLKAICLCRCADVMEKPCTSKFFEIFRKEKPASSAS